MLVSQKSRKISGRCSERDLRLPEGAPCVRSERGRGAARNSRVRVRGGAVCIKMWVKSAEIVVVSGTFPPVCFAVVLLLPLPGLCGPAAIMMQASPHPRAQRSPTTPPMRHLNAQNCESKGGPAGPCRRPHGRHSRRRCLPRASPGSCTMRVSPLPRRCGVRRSWSLQLGGDGSPEHPISCLCSGASCTAGGRLPVCLSGNIRTPIGGTSVARARRKAAARARWRCLCKTLQFQDSQPSASLNAGRGAYLLASAAGLRPDTRVEPDSQPEGCQCGGWPGPRP